MAQNAVLFEVVPDDPEVDLNTILEEIKKRLPEGTELKDAKIEPFVFGLNKLKVLIVIPESEEVLKEVESRISDIKGVSAEVVTITRL